MATLTPEQTDFLKQHHIPLDKTFDASGLSHKQYKASMKENGALVAYGVAPCPTKGHTLRNKQGNCIQCNPQAIASLKHQARMGDVYMAISPSTYLTKIGVIDDASQIQSKLNAQRHASIDDWQVVMIAHSEALGQAENQLKLLLSNQQIAKKLTPQGKTQKASAIYLMDPDEALLALNELPITIKTLDTTALEQFHQDYITMRQHQDEAEQLKMAERAQQAKLDEMAERQAEQEKLAAQQQLREQAQQQKIEKKRQRQQLLQTERQAKREIATKQIPLQAAEQVPTQNTLTKRPSMAVLGSRLSEQSAIQKIALGVGICLLIALLLAMLWVFGGQ